MGLPLYRHTTPGKVRSDRIVARHRAFVGERVTPQRGPGQVAGLWLSGDTPQEATGGRRRRFTPRRGTATPEGRGGGTGAAQRPRQAQRTGHTQGTGHRQAHRPHRTRHRPREATGVHGYTRRGCVRSGRLWGALGGTQATGHAESPGKADFSRRGAVWGGSGGSSHKTPKNDGLTPLLQKMC